MVTSWNWQCLIKNNLFVENKYRSIQPLALVVLGINQSAWGTDKIRS